MAMALSPEEKQARYEADRKIGRTLRPDGIHVGAGRTPGSVPPTQEMQDAMRTYPERLKAQLEEKKGGA
jgi:hypothetical protein